MLNAGAYLLLISMYLIVPLEGYDGNHTHTGSFEDSQCQIIGVYCTFYKVDQHLHQWKQN